MIKTVFSPVLPKPRRQLDTMMKLQRNLSYVEKRGSMKVNERGGFIRGIMERYSGSF